MVDHVTYDKRWKPTPVSGAIDGVSGTITATAGRTLLIVGEGSWGNVLTAQTVSLSYDGVILETQPVASVLGLGLRIPFSLTGRVTAVASATAEVTSSGGTMYDVHITWIEHSDM